MANLQRVIRRGEELRGNDESDGCLYSTFVKTVCSLAQEESGKPVQKCEKIEQLLRKCAGRPQEIVESNVEVTQADVSISHSPFAEDADFKAGTTFAMPEQWLERSRRSGEPLFQERTRVVPGSFDDFLQDIFSVPLGVAQEDGKSQYPRGPRDPVDRPLGWFNGGGFIGDLRRKVPRRDSSSNGNNKGCYDGLKGIQEV